MGVGIGIGVAGGAALYEDLKEAIGDLWNSNSKGKSDKKRIGSAESHLKNIEDAIDKVRRDPENSR